MRMELDRADEELLLEKDPRQAVVGRRGQHQNLLFAVAFAANFVLVGFIAVRTHSRD